MHFTPWQIGRIRSRLITYYFHQKSYVSERAARSATIKQKEKMEDRGWTEDTVSFRQSYRWMDVAREIIESNHTELNFPDEFDEDGAEDAGWEITEETLRRFYDGVNKPAIKDSRGNKFRSLQIPPESSLNAIYLFLKKEVRYLVDDDLVEPNFWPLPDDDLMFDIGANHDDLRVSQFPLLVSRDYISQSTQEEELKYALLSIDAKYSYKPARIRYITQDNLHIQANYNPKRGMMPNWSWYWGWMVYPNTEFSILKLKRDRSFNATCWAFIAFNFMNDGDHIVKFSLSKHLGVRAKEDDKTVCEKLFLMFNSGVKLNREFKRCTEINLTNFVRNYRFDIDDDQRPAVLGYKETPEGEDDDFDQDQKPASLVEELFSKIRSKLPFGGRDKDMVEATTPVEGKYYSSELVLWEGHVMDLCLDEVVAQGKLDERLIQTMDIGYPWHIDELIKLGADPNYVTPDDNACALHFIASNSSAGHLSGFTHAVKAAGKSITFNVKTKRGHLPSDVAADHCVDPDIIEYFFKMEALEREGQQFTPYELPEEYRGPNFEDLIPI